MYNNQYPYNVQQQQQQSLPLHPPLPPPHHQFSVPQSDSNAPFSTQQPIHNALAQDQKAELLVNNPASHANPQNNLKLAPLVTSYLKQQPPQQRPQQHSTYNPGDYTPISPTNNFQSHWSLSPPLSQTPSQPAYNPANYPPVTTPVQRLPNFPSYANSPPGFSATSYSPQQTTVGARQTPSFPRVSANFPSHFGHAAPPPLPVIPSAGASPADDWGKLPPVLSSSVNRYASSSSNNNRYTSTRYGPAYPSPTTISPQHSRTSSALSANSVQLSPSAIPPQPPLHASSLTFHQSNHPLSSDQNSHPLPRLPPSVNNDHDADDNQDEDNEDDTNSQSLIQQQLEHQILASVGRSGTQDVSDADLEALAGLEAMGEAERQEQEDNARRSSSHSSRYPPMSRSSVSTRSQQLKENRPEDIDLSSIEGGWNAHMSYGGSPDLLTVDRNNSTGSQFTLPVERYNSNSSYHNRQNSTTSIRRQTLSGQQDNYNSGIGGLPDISSTGNRRLSFDESDDSALTGENAAAGYEFFHPGITNRPLPSPPDPGYLRQSQSSSAIPQQWRASTDQLARDSTFQVNPPAPNRHTSMVNHSATPPLAIPIRAITDADERKRAKRTSTLYPEHQQSTPQDNALLDLPGVVKRFNTAKLTAFDFNKCQEPWSIRAIGSWLKALVKEDQYLKKPVLIDGLVALFTHKVRAMNIADAELLAAKIIDQMLASQTLYAEEEWIAFSEIESSGVIIQMTGSGCYSSRAHSTEMPTKCYSSQCQRTEKKMPLSGEADISLEEDWMQHWSLTSIDLADYDKKEIARQNNLHEVIQKEEKFVMEMDILQTLYRDNLVAADPPIISLSLIDEIFGKADAVRNVNDKYLLPQIKYRQKEQGPFISGFSSIYREWIRRAKTAYLDYAAAFPNASYKMKLEKKQNQRFNGFLDSCQSNPRSRKLDYTNYLKVPITHIQQVILLLETILILSTVENDEKDLLEKAVSDIKKVTHELDSRVPVHDRKVALASLSRRLKFRLELGKFDLKLNHLGRELVLEGELKRESNSNVKVVSYVKLLDSHGILLDNFLILGRAGPKPDGSSRDLLDVLDVTKPPIPIDMLVLESRSDDAVSPTAALGGLGLVRLTPIQNIQPTRPAINTPPGLQHTASYTSVASVASNKTITPLGTSLPDKDERTTYYPFRVKHLGTENYTLYALSSKGRDDWCDNILKVQAMNAEMRHQQRSEPFRLKVLADAAFGYESGAGALPSIPIPGTPLDRAVREVELLYSNFTRPNPICRVKVNCATSFQRADGKQMLAVGTDFGVYLTVSGDARGWAKVIHNKHVSQIAVLEDFQLFLILSYKSLIAYHLDAVCPTSGGSSVSSHSSQSAPQKLSGNRDVGFFATARMKERTLVFYKIVNSASSTFKVIEPVLVKMSEKKSRFPPFRSGKTDFFRDFDEFYIGTECFSMNLFKSSIAIATDHGFETLNLDLKFPNGIPSFDESPESQEKRTFIYKQKPLAMLRISEQEFLLAYEKGAVYLHKNGEISRGQTLKYLGRAQRAALYGPYLILFNPEFVEIWNATNGRFRQIIAGTHVRCLDDGTSGGSAGHRTIKLAMMHPEAEKVQIIVEMTLREGMTD